MASSSSTSLLCSLLFFFVLLVFPTNAQNGVPLSLKKDPKTRQYYTTITMGSNRSPINVIVDLGGPYLWFSCNDYKSNTYAPIPCGSPKCELAKGIGCYGCNLPKRPGCTNDTCAASPYNPFTNMLVSQGFYEDSFHPAGRLAPLTRFVFSCMDKDYLEGLANGTTGMLGLGRTEISLHKQVVGVFGFADKFSVCFPSSSSLGFGKLLVGGLVFTESIIATKTTPLVVNPVSTYPIFVEGERSDEYFIGVKSIRVAGETVSVKDSYFAINNKGVGGTKISSLQNFTALHNSIYKPFTRAFVKAAANMKIKSAAAVAPFRACFKLETITRTAAGALVPDIDFVLPGKDVYWRISGANSMVEIDRKTSCLAFVDGGSEPRTTIVIGGHQMEENFLEFDLVNSQLKFSSSLLVQNKSCSNVIV
ncbi:hypothetical protein ACP275_07G026800 [Erythranthe tilingii]